MTTTRQRVAGLSPGAHIYAKATDGLLPAGALVGLTVTLPGGRTVLVGPDQVDLDAGAVTSWQISLGDGWITGVSWPTAEQAADAASDPDTLAALSEYRDVRRREWAARQEARELAERAGQLLADLAGPPCAGTGRRHMIRRGRTAMTCSVCGHTEPTDEVARPTLRGMPRHTRKVTDR